MTGAAQVTIGQSFCEKSAARGLFLRPEAEADAAFSDGLFVATRRAMFDSAALPEEAKSALLASQAAIQRRSYRMSYPDAEFLIIEGRNGPIGRLYLWCGEDERRIIDISLLPEARGQGIGTALIRDVQRIAAAERRAVRLQVDPSNRALSLYRRLGFQETGPEAGNLGLIWRA